MKKLNFSVIGNMFLAISFIIVGILILPSISDLGYKFTEYIVGVGLVFYIGLYLFPSFKNFKKKEGFVKTLMIIELIIVGLLALGSFLSYFKIIDNSSPSKIFGIVFWLRGVNAILIMTYHRSSSKSYVYLYIAFITFGTYLYIKNFITTKMITIILGITLILCGLLFFYFAYKRIKK